MSTTANFLARLLAPFVRVTPAERRAVLLAFACNFMLLGSYYILRPVRDTVATVFGAGDLQYLFTGTFIGTLIASPLYSALAARLKLRRLLPGVFWFWLLNVLLFLALFRALPGSRVVDAAYYIWFSVVNLFMVSVFWSLMADLFTSSQAPRLFAFISAGGSTGAIAGPVVTRLFVRTVGLDGLLLIAAAGFVIVIALVHWLMREKERLRALGAEAQPTSLDQGLPGGSFDGFLELMRSPYSRRQAAFMLLMTWVSTVAYFLQTDVIAHAFSEVESRAVAIADISLVVNISAALILLLGLGRYVQRFGVTAGLLLNPLMMVAAFIGLVLSPTLLMIQALQVVRQAGQFAIARPSREMCFTVVPQKERYRTKNVIDTVIYRLGDVVAAWMQAGMRMLGAGIYGSSLAGIAFSAVWGGAALALGRQYERLRQQASLATAQTPANVQHSQARTTWL
jgi:AAA family ATP:ADP antiporter